MFFSLQTKSPLLSLIVLLNFITATVFAQEPFAYEANLPSVDSSGFYRFSITPEILALCENDLRDIRLFNADGKEVPYMIINGSLSAHYEFVPFPIKSKMIAPDRRMHVQVKNPGKAVSQLVLQVQNSYASRTVNINGSNDGSDWFSIRDNVIVNATTTDSTGFFYFLIDLPLSKTNYFDIAFKDKGLLPVNIIAAGIFKEELTAAQYDTISTIKVIQNDSTDKSSYITLNWNAPYPFEFIKPEITGPPYYRRQLIFQNKTYDQSQIIQSDQSNWLPFDIKSASIQIKILNEDNPPLQISGAKGLVQRGTLCAWLEKRASYRIVFGNSLAKQPKYDLAYFKELVGKDAPELKVSTVKVNTTSTVITPVNRFNKIWLWLAMGAVLLLLLLITFRLTKSIKGKQ